MECEGTHPTNQYEFYQWLIQFNNKKNDFSALQQAQLLIQAIDKSAPDLQFMRGLSDQQQEVGAAPFLDLSADTKEIIRVRALEMLPDQKLLLLLVRNYISSDTLRIINLEQRIIELWRQSTANREQLQQVYYWFSDILFKDNPVVLEIIKWPHLPEHDLIVWSQKPEDLLLLIPFDLGKESQRQAFVRMTGACQAPIVVQNAVNRHLPRLFQEDAKQAVKLIIRLRQTSPGCIIPITNRQLLSASSVSQQLDDSIIDLFIDKLSHGQDIWSDIWADDPKYIINQRLPHLLFLVLSITHTSITQYQSEVLINQLIRRIFTNRKAILDNTKLLIFLLSRLKVDILDYVAKQMVSCIKFCQYSQAYVGCMAIIQACYLDGLDMNLVELLNSSTYIEALHSLEQNQPYRRLLVLTISKIKKMDDYLWQLIYNQLYALRIMKPVMKQQKKIDTIIKLENTRYLHKIDEFQAARQLYDKNARQFPFRRHYRYFTEHSSGIRLHVPIKR